MGNEPTALPDGAEVELTFVEGDKFEPGDRVQLETSLDLGEAQASAGRLADGDGVIQTGPTRG